MDWFLWGAVLLVVYSLLQIPAVLFVSRYVELDEEERREPPVWGRGVGADVRQFERPDAPESPTARTCGSCGADNDPAFVYCRCCVARLA